MQEKLSQAAENESSKFQEAQEIAKNNYLEMLEELAEEHKHILAVRSEELRQVEEKLAIMRAKAEIEEYNGKYIVYSLGNFSFSGNNKPSDMASYIFQVRMQ